ncbi:hypothetical protein [Hansschlegelia plantiphila]|uniref:Uncharacterized protein n=1 Tax=Hansschlegelia plantiphila TaxID=374655 RepID=A0A9W6J1R4_9HYPH|nr:hypothetical protein [Hansschlegelia plantiphila]GLK67679.1 hypothetical protein GCM10008179_13170 [Hansschlegelia plantiphila]
MPPFLLIAAAAAGALFGAKALKREWLRVNRELERTEREQAGDAEPRPTLKHDKTTGEWRPQ